MTDQPPRFLNRPRSEPVSAEEGMRIVYDSAHAEVRRAAERRQPAASSETASSEAAPHPLRPGFGPCDVLPPPLADSEPPAE